MKTYAVIPTHNRPAELATLLDSIPADVHVLVIDNASSPPVAALSGAGFNPYVKDGVFDFTRFLGRRIRVIRDEEQPPNLSRLWNIGLDWAEDLQRVANMESDLGPAPWCVAILNDDVVLPPSLLWQMAEEIKNHGVDVSFPGAVGERCFVNTLHPFPGVHYRMTGWCFMVRGLSGLRADERLRWWCGDDDLQAAAVRTGRGSVRFEMDPGMASGLLHKYPDQSTRGVLAEQTHRDMKTFVKKWGSRPW